MTVRRFVVVAVLAVSVAGGGATVAALAASARSAPAAQAGVYSRLARQLKQQLPRSQPSMGFSCAIAAGGSCSLHPCTVYTYTTSATASATVAPALATTSRCRNAANAPVRQIPISTG